MRFAYADPPYPGQAHRYPEKQEVDHAALIAELEHEFPDGWALSTSASALRDILPLCPAKTRVGAWVKTWQPAMWARPPYGWEPVLWRGGRYLRDAFAVRDWHSTAPTGQQRILGQKPETFCFWVFQLLGARPGDELVDVFPGTGAVGRAWQKYIGQLEFQLA